MQGWQWRVPPLVMGNGCAFDELPAFLASKGRRWAVCVGRHFRFSLWEKWQRVASSMGLEVEAFVVEGGEPTVPMVDEMTNLVRQWQPDGLVGIGGGSVLDTTKAVAAMLRHEGSVEEYLEGVGTKQLSREPLPWIGVPTTAGTGSEVTKNAVIIVPQKRVKRSLRHDSLWATMAFLDPELTLSQSWEVTVNAALDAFTHLVEAAVSQKSHPWATALADASLMNIIEGLNRVQTVPDDREAREKLLMASTAGGIALANAGLGAIHGFAATLGGMTSLPHGRVCGILLDHVIEVNSRFTDVYEMLSLVKSYGGVSSFLRFLRQWKQKLGVESDFKPWRLSLSPEEIVHLSRSSSMRANPAEIDASVWISLWQKIV